MPNARAEHTHSSLVATLNAKCRDALRAVDADGFTQPGLDRAFTTIYDACRRPLLGRLRGFARSLERADEPEDVAQRAFISFYRVVSDTHRREQLAASEPYTYLLVLVSRAAIDSTRRAHTRGPDSGPDPDATLSQLVDPAADAATVVALGQALEALNTQETTLLIAAAAGMRSEEIAAMTGMTAANVRQRTHRARHKLQQTVQRETHDAEP